ncbi:uncharacterized protein LOC110899993 [Helianthus annuus]|uniref:uncharacterized protein LOC110899993 n=1 Tax=Helianthus annuus TaxID=4232 RepID=UPI000B8FCE1F|nr:uncharacterized protein LOC110899993 [Helianthus annuus]XP_022002586.1 uncharacterized protein LOC110899993 [Helianthus annuus]XP_022002587.1 uncharacterized protein LOC110899993 [Helianthus annuus]XP_022002588.1 uncharacterized protein LOC110899993 [Helianthus annuus]
MQGNFRRKNDERRRHRRWSSAIIKVEEVKSNIFPLLDTAPELVPVQYGGLSREGEQEFTSGDAVIEELFKSATKHAVDFPVTEIATRYLVPELAGKRLTPLVAYRCFFMLPSYRECMNIVL